MDSIGNSKNVMSSKYYYDNDDDKRIKRKASHSTSAHDDVDVTQKIDKSVRDVKQ